MTSLNELQHLGVETVLQGEVHVERSGGLLDIETLGFLPQECWQWSSTCVDFSLGLDKKYFSLQ